MSMSLSQDPVIVYRGREHAAQKADASMFMYKEYGQMGEWLKPSDCKSDLNRALVRIQLCPPYMGSLV